MTPDLQTSKVADTMKYALLTADIGNPMPNIGDYFITRAIEEIFEEHTLLKIPMHQTPTDEVMATLSAQDALVICGSNLIGANGTLRISFESHHFEKLNKPIITMGLGSQADWGGKVNLDERGVRLLKTIHSFSGPISVRDSLTKNFVNSVLGEGAAVFTGCPSVTLKVRPSPTTEKVTLFCSGPYHYEPPLIPWENYHRLTREIAAAVTSITPFIFLAQQPSDFQFHIAKPGLESLYSPMHPKTHLKILVSSEQVVSFRIHPCIVAVTHGVPAYLIAIDERTKSLAESVGIPYFVPKEIGNAKDFIKWWKKTKENYPWKEIIEKVNTIRANFSLPEKFEKKGKPHHVAVIASHDYLPSLFGLLENFKELGWVSQTLHVLCLDPWDVEKLQKAFPEFTFHFYPAFKNRNAYASKPKFLAHLVEKGVSPVLFMDVDLYFFESPESLFEETSDSSLLLFPHYHESAELDLRYGKFNAGLIRVGKGSLSFLKWWADRCEEKCERKLGNYFEQSYMDQAPHWVEHTAIHETGLHNSGPWRPVPAKAKSFHAAQPDAQGYFEIKQTWDQMMGRLNFSLKELSVGFGMRSCEAQRRHWYQLKRFLYLKDLYWERGIHVRWYRPSLSFWIIGKGRFLLSALTRIYWRLKHFRVVLRTWKSNLKKPGFSTTKALNPTEDTI
jgi:hypothetical protein